MDDKNVKTLREMQRRSKANKSCFECGERGPSYVCLNFNTFVCTECSGILREFSYRVKGISMSKFTEEEMSKIKAGGNVKAKKIWLAKHREGEFQLPQPGQRSRVRKFIQQKYQDKRWFRNPNRKKADSGSDSSSSDSSSEDEAAAARRRAKELKKMKKKKKKKKKKAVESSSEDSSSEEEQTAPKRNIKDVMPNAPRLIIGKDKKKSSKPKEKTKVTSKPKEEEPNLLDWGFDTPAEQPAPTQAARLSDDWGDFAAASTTPQTQQPAVFSQPQPGLDDFASFSGPQQPSVEPSSSQHQAEDLSDPFAMLSMDQPSSSQPTTNPTHSRAASNMSASSRRSSAGSLDFNATGMMQQQQPQNMMGGNMMPQQGMMMQPNMQNMMQPQNQQGMAMQQNTQQQQNQQGMMMQPDMQNMMQSNIQQQPSMMQQQPNMMSNMMQQPNMMQQNQMQYGQQHTNGGSMQQQMPNMYMQQQQAPASPPQSPKVEEEGNPFDLF